MKIVLGVVHHDGPLLKVWRDVSIQDDGWQQVALCSTGPVLFLSFVVEMKGV